MSNPQSPIPNHQIFDRKRVRLHRDRGAARFKQADFLFREMAARLSDRLEDINRRFPLALDLGAHNGLLAEHLKGKNGIERLVQTDLSLSLLASRNTKHEARNTPVVADEEFLPFADNSFDAVFSVGSLHWANDLPGALIQINRALKPDGLFIAMLPGGQTLKELRRSLEQSEMNVSGGVSPRVSPFIDVRDGAALLQRAGFAMPVAESEMLTVKYADPLRLLHDLRGMGESNALAESARGFSPRRVLFGALEHYRKHHADETGKLDASIELVTLTGWKKN